MATCDCGLTSTAPVWRSSDGIEHTALICTPTGPGPRWGKAAADPEFMAATRVLRAYTLGHTVDGGALAAEVRTLAAKLGVTTGGTP